VAADDYNETTGAPEFAGTGAPDTAVDLTLVAAFAALVGTRLIGTTAERNAYEFAREGLRWYDTDTDTEYLHNGSAWVAVWHDWKSWNPTFSNFSLGNGSISAKYRRNGRMIEFIIALTLGSTSAATGAIGFSTPVAPADALIKHARGGVLTRAAVPSTPYPVQMRIAGGSTINVALGTSSGAVLATTNWSNTYPAAPANGDTLYLEGAYEVA